MVKGPGADNLADSVRNGDREFALDLGRGKQDALVGQKLGRVCNIRGGAGVEKDIVA